MRKSTPVYRPRARPTTGQPNSAFPRAAPIGSALHFRCNDVVPREKLLERAWKLADHIMTHPRILRRLTTHIVRRPWKQRVADDLDGGFGIQMFAHLAKQKSMYGCAHIADSISYVREAKEIPIK